MVNIFGKHFGTQRYFAIVALCLTVIIVTCSYSGYLAGVANRETLGNTVVYTDSTIWSRTQNYATVVNVASNSDHTKIFMLLQNTASDANMDLQTSNAEDYVMFITKRDGTLEQAPKVTVYGYGNTGYVGFYFTNASGFDSEIWSIILRNDTVASGLMEEGDIWANAENDVSFREHNQIRLYVNFGGADMQTIPSLDAERFDPISAYSDFMCVSDFNSSQRELQNYLSNMRQNMLLIEQYRSRLESQGVQVQALPYYIAGDMVNTVPNDFNTEALYFTPDMVTVNGSGFGDDFYSGTDNSGFGDFGNGTPSESTPTEPAASDNLYEDTTTASADAPGYTSEEDGVFHPYYYLHTSCIFPGGLNVDWQHMTSADTIIAQLPDLYYGINNLPVPSDTSGLGYFDIYGAYSEWYGRWKTSEQYNFVTAQFIRNSSDANHSFTWRRITNNGIEYIDFNNTSIANQSIVDDITAYESAVNAYIVNKTAYFEAINSMILYEANIRSMESIMTVNDKDNVYAY